MSGPIISEAEIEATLKGNDPESVTEITNENALIIIAQALIGIEKHLMAQVYLANTRDPEKSGVTYVSDVFQAIYDGSDPFAEVDAAVKAAKDADPKKTHA